MVQKFFLVGEDEIADFHGSLKSFGFSTDDFELSETVAKRRHDLRHHDGISLFIRGDKILHGRS